MEDVDVEIIASLVWSAAMARRGERKYCSRVFCPWAADPFELALQETKYTRIADWQKLKKKTNQKTWDIEQFYGKLNLLFTPEVLFLSIVRLFWNHELLHESDFHFESSCTRRCTVRRAHKTPAQRDLSKNGLVFFPHVLSWNTKKHKSGEKKSRNIMMNDQKILEVQKIRVVVQSKDLQRFAIYRRRGKIFKLSGNARFLCIR